MLSLEDYQRGMLALIKGRAVPPGSVYIQQVAASPGLAIVREIALFWRTFEIGIQCRLTWRLLTRLGSGDALVAGYFNHNPTSPFVEQLGLGFLEWLADHDDALVRAVAGFELAIMRIKGGMADAAEIRWDRDPERVLHVLQTGGELPHAEDGPDYLLRIGGKQADLITCSRAG